MQIKNGFHLIRNMLTTVVRGNNDLIEAPSPPVPPPIPLPPPEHNNNQPFSNLDLPVREVTVDVSDFAATLPQQQREELGGDGIENVAVYSLVEGGGGRGEDWDGGVVIRNERFVDDEDRVVGVYGGEEEALLFLDGEGFDEEGLSDGDDDGDDSDNLKFIMNEFGFLELVEGQEGSDGDGVEVEEAEEAEEDDGEGMAINGTVEAAAVTLPNENGVGGEEGEEGVIGEEGSGVEETASSSNEVENVSCVTCGCFGLREEFFDADDDDALHCSYDCSVAMRISERLELEEEEEEDKENEGGEDRRRDLKRRLGGDENRGDVVDGIKRVRIDGDDEESGSSYSSSESLEDDEGVLIRNPFRVNDVFEAIDPVNPILFCPVRVVEVIGYRMLLKFIGYSEKYSFWVDADSEDLFPAGWSESYRSKTSSSPSDEEQRCSLHFHTPPTFSSWPSYKSQNPTHRIAPRSNFKHVDEIIGCVDNGIRVGMKLEAVDVRSKGRLVCVATVTCVLGSRFLCHFDSWDSLYDIWVDSVVDEDGNRCYGDVVFPVGYCEKVLGTLVTPPHCYETPSEFDWEEYLKKTDSIKMPDNLFRKAGSSPMATKFTLNQQIEVIDKRAPRLLRRATVANINEHSISIKFDGLGNEFGYDIPFHNLKGVVHEVGWGEKSGHPVICGDEGGSLSSREFPVCCPNHVVCKSVCSVRGVWVSYHGRVKDCPYERVVKGDGEKEKVRDGDGDDSNDEEEEDDDDDYYWRRYTDRVVVYEDQFYGVKRGIGGSGGGDEDVDDEEQEEDDDNDDGEVESCSGSDGDGDEDDDEVEEEEELDYHHHRDEVNCNDGDDDDVDERTAVKEEEVKVTADSQEQPLINEGCVSLETDDGNVTPTTPPHNQPSSPPPATEQKHLPQPTPPAPPQPPQIPKRSEIIKWSHEEVAGLVERLCSNLPSTAAAVGEQFRKNLIDGESFLMLTQGDLTEVLGIRLGPAVKIFNLIRMIVGKK